MTGGGGHGTPCRDIISGALEGSDVGVNTPCSLTHRQQLRTLSTSVPLLSRLYTSNTGGVFYIGRSIGFSPLVKFFQLSIHD
ncbi:MAG: hypothetical protein J07HQX50_01668 [Haloquadratum sp. J07HQX50]|nr:MAG: hypothetical protein J07HQX50_01668 [Haloquadratum sp. J07HQX50]